MCFTSDSHRRGFHEPPLLTPSGRREGWPEVRTWEVEADEEEKEEGDDDDDDDDDDEDDEEDDEDDDVEDDEFSP